MTLRVRLIIAALLLALASSVSATGAAVPAQSETIRHRIEDCFDRADYAAAASLIEEYLRDTPNDPAMLYNLACARARLGETDEAARALLRAFRAGFRDIEHLRSDPDLESLRDHPTYSIILERADLAVERRARGAVDQWRAAFGVEAYRYETDEDRRINYATALDDQSHADMRAMLERQADQMIKSLFREPPRNSVLIAVPTPEDSDRIFKGRDEVGGMYEHALRRLVARDIGATLRHEFCHALHFAHMERIGQKHPLWIQEGLAALYEDYEFDGDGTIRFVPNDRQLIVKNRARAGTLIRWRDLFEMSSEDFMRGAQKMYPQARSIFEFVADQVALERWYELYVANFDSDRTGAKAFELAFDSSIDEVERRWRQWVKEQPAVDFHIGSRDAALGIRSADNLSNDGVLITEVVPGSAAARARLRRGDVLVAIDGKRTNSLADLRRIIAAKRVGDAVDVRARRGSEYFEVKVTLRPLYAPH